jgi:hypothetical protein
LEEMGIKKFVDLEKMKEALDQPKGVPIEITSDFNHGR